MCVCVCGGGGGLRRIRRMEKKDEKRMNNEMAAKIYMKCKFYTVEITYRNNCQPGCTFSISQEISASNVR